MANQPTLKAVMLTRFGISYGLILLVTFLVCLISIVVITDKVKSQSRDALHMQIKRNVLKLMDTADAQLDAYLKSTSEGIVKLVAEAAEDMLYLQGVSSYTAQSQPSYFDYTTAYLAPPLVYDDKQKMQVSLAHSTHYWPGSTPAGHVNLSTTENSTIAGTVHLDSFFKRIYSGRATDLYAIYTGYENGGIFRKYPGASSLLNDPTRAYDPRIRGWYSTAKGQPTAPILTSPYNDFHSLRWMVTIASAIHSNPAVPTSSVIGVCGADILIDSITEAVESMKILQGGKVTLLEISGGRVVADKEWNRVGDTVGLLYSDLKSPAISASLWANIQTNTPAAGNGVLFTSANGYLVAAGRLASFSSRYVFVVHVPESEITAPIDALLNEINGFKGLLIAIVAILFVVMCLVTVGLIVLTSSVLTQPIHQVEENAALMVKNIGKPNLAEGAKWVDGGLGEEMSDFATSFNNMVKTLQEKRGEVTSETENPFFPPKAKPEDAALLVSV